MCEMFQGNFYNFLAPSLNIALWVFLENSEAQFA